MIRRISGVFCIVLLFGFAPEESNPSSAKATEGKPNILIILVDDMGWSDLGCYGAEIKTPNLDKLAAGGIRYTQMHNTAKCYPTRASLLTGLYFQQTDRDFTGTVTAGEVLRPAGYHTWWSGKHHARFNPHGRGFDHFFGFLGGAINFWNPGGEARSGEPNPPGAVYTWADDAKLTKPFIPPKGWYATDAFTDHALKWLDESRGDEKPFFLYVAYNAPHWPLHARPEDIARYKGVYDGGYDVVRRARWKRQQKLGLFDPKRVRLSEPEYASDWDSLSDVEKKQESLRMAIHAAMVDRVDQNVGRLVKKLRETDRLDNTLILFLADNGASAERPRKGQDPDAPWGSVGSFEAIGRSWATTANTPMRKWKTSSHEGGAGTPMIAHWPKGIREPGRFYRGVCHLIDIMPTLVALSGAKYPATGVPPMEGISLSPSFEGRPLDRKVPLFWEFGKGNAIREGKWKLVRSRSDWELYDMDTDRTETNDLASHEPDRVKAMTATWEAWFKRCTGKPYTGPTNKKPKKNKKKKC